jgi:hypothetical protein
MRSLTSSGHRRSPDGESRTQTTDGLEPPPEIIAYYEQFPEEVRPEMGPFKLEFARTKDILGRLLPPPPGRIVDVGWGGGCVLGMARWAWIRRSPHRCLGAPGRRSKKT